MRCERCKLVTPADEEGRCSVCGDELALCARELLSGKDKIVTEEREGQIKVAEAVELALRLGEKAVAEAPVGTGKALAYGIPAALAKGKRTVISTATHALQAQLIDKDLPFLQAALAKRGVEFSFAIAKGKENYVCGKAVTTLAEDQHSGANFTPEFVRWAKQAQRGEHSGDKTLLGDTIPPEWPYINANHCYAKNCPYSTSCGFIRTQNKMRGAQVVVTNHSTIGFDVALSRKARKDANGDSTVKNPLLGPFDILVFDEAHNAARYIRDAFSYTAHENAPVFARNILEKRGLHSNPNAFNAVQAVYKLFFDRLPRPVGQAVSVTEEIAKTASLSTIAERLGQAVDAYLVPYKKTVSKAESKLNGGDSLTGAEEQDFRACREVVRRYEDVMLAAHTVGRVTQTYNLVCYVRKLKDGQRELIASPLKVGGYLKETLYPNLQSVIATSATMAVNGSFAVIKDELGIEVVRPELEIRVRSPFDLERRAVFYVSRALSVDPPSPTDALKMRTYANEVASEVKRLTDITKGRAFVLFTSAKELEAVYAQLLRHGLNMRKQDAQNRADYLQQWYRSEAQLGRRPVLLGLKSFWEGVSVEGDDLSCVIVVKLPFPQQDPIYEALCKKSADPFNQVTFPLMVRELQQGTGRLIRTMSDRGIVAILDRRVTTKGYSGKVLNSLPFARPLLSMEAVAEAYSRLIR